MADEKFEGNIPILILGSVTIAATYIISITPTRNGEKVESTGMGDAWKTFLSNLPKGGGLAINGYNSKGGSAGSTTLRKAVEDWFSATGRSVTFDLRPEGTGSGLPKWTGTIILDDDEWPLEKLSAAFINVNGTFTGTLTQTTQGA